MATNQEKLVPVDRGLIEKSFEEFEKILRQDRFKHVNHDLKEAKEYITNTFGKSVNVSEVSEYSFAGGLIRVPYERIFVSGGYFFKYPKSKQDNPYSNIFPEEYKKFKNDQRIDLYFNYDFAKMDITKIFKPKFKTQNGTVMSLELDYNGAKITINYLQCNDTTIKTGTSAIIEFDAELYKVAYHIKSDRFIISSWFNPENFFNDLFPNDVDPTRKLKFKMKGFYNMEDENAICDAAENIQRTRKTEQMPIAIKKKRQLSPTDSS